MNYRTLPTFLCLKHTRIFSCLYLCYYFVMRNLPSEVLGPFLDGRIQEETLGPFSSLSTTEPLVENKPMLDAMGITKETIQNMLSVYPHAKEILNQPEAETLRDYLDGNRNYDIHILNNLIAELSDGFRMRQSLQERTTPVKPIRFDSTVPRSERDSGDQSVAPTATRGPVPDVGYTEEGETGNPAPSEWWLSKE